MITEFGKLLRNIRMDRGEYLKDMAGKLGVTSSYLSSVENGNRSVPVKWIGQITEMYGLSKEESERLSNLAVDAGTSVRIDVRNSTSLQRQAALAFARNFQLISDEVANEIINLLRI